MLILLARLWRFALCVSIKLVEAGSQSLPGVVKHDKVTSFFEFIWTVMRANVTKLRKQMLFIITIIPFGNMLQNMNRLKILEQIASDENVKVI